MTEVEVCFSWMSEFFGQIFLSALIKFQAKLFPSQETSASFGIHGREAGARPVSFMPHKELAEKL